MAVRDHHDLLRLDGVRQHRDAGVQGDGAQAGTGTLAEPDGDVDAGERPPDPRSRRRLE
jgi:hypothetical protein